MSEGGERTSGIRTERLTRTYLARPRRRGASVITALDDVSLDIPVGTIHGLLGPNGAGKTTLVKVLSTVLLPTRGHAAIMGHDVVKDTSMVRSLIGVAYGGERGLYYRLTGRQNIEFWAALYRVPASIARNRAAELLEHVSLTDKADSRVETYSRGMKQRLHLARALIHDPPVLLLDEPTAGMDPVGGLQFRKLLSELATEGRTILLTTHDMAEAESLCDRVTLIGQGRVLTTDAPDALARQIFKYERVEFAAPSEHLLARLLQERGVRKVDRVDSVMTCVETDRADAMRSVLALLVQHGVTTIRTSNPNLEDVYLQLFRGPDGTD